MQKVAGNRLDGVGRGESKREEGRKSRKFDKPTWVLKSD